MGWGAKREDWSPLLAVLCRAPQVTAIASLNPGRHLWEPGVLAPSQWVGVGMAPPAGSEPPKLDLPSLLVVLLEAKVALALETSSLACVLGFWGRLL